MMVVLMMIGSTFSTRTFIIPVLILIAIFIVVTRNATGGGVGRPSKDTFQRDTIFEQILHLTHHQTGPFGTGMPVRRAVIR